MAEENGRRTPFTVHCSGVVAKELRQLQESASAGERKQIAAAFRTIVKQLQTNPTAIGEPLYRLAELGMDVRTVVVAPLAITYAVSKDKSLVFIKSGSKLNSH